MDAVKVAIMKPKLIFGVCILLIGIGLFGACKKNDDQVSAPISKPIANAGITQTIRLPTDSVTLDASTSTGAIFSYQWNKVSGPATFSIQNASASKTVVKKLVPGVYEFELKVTDIIGFSSHAMVQVTVLAPMKNARILEYGTDLPLPGVSVEAYSKTGRLYFETDTNGQFSFDGNEIGLGKITKTGYWNGIWNLNFGTFNYLFAPVTFFPGNAFFDYHTGYISSVDSFVVKLFPKKNITIRIKDSLGLCTSGDCNVIFTANALFTQQGTNQTVVAGEGGIPNEPNSWFVGLRPHIDTTFQYAVCANTVNTFTIGDYAFDSGWYSDYFSRDTIFIANSSNMILNFTY